ncbi:hypothetical protein FRB97_008124 [Tulasnella sp. 331]|nr:hypothetical protein FRB97_008124 [Tulasnella sp. 331]
MRYGHYEYTVMPFGLTNAPANFQLFMNDIFRDMLDHKVVIYLDNILIFAKTQTEHDAIVMEVLRRLKANNVWANHSKSEFNLTEIEYLRFIIDGTTMRMDKAKIAAIKEWPIPKSVHDIQVFLGFANFYRRFIQGYSKIAQPMMDLLKKHEKFVWGSKQQASLDAFKQAFMSSPVLAFPDFDKPYVVETDSSVFARGAILSQKGEDGKLHPIAYASKSLSPAERNYDVYDLELLVIYEAFRDWRQYLEGANGQTTVITDHANLETFMTTKEPSRRQARWSLFLAGFDFKIVYRPGVKARPDPLSRRPDHQPRGEEKIFKSILKKSNFEINSTTFSDKDFVDRIRQTLKEDKSMSAVLAFLRAEQTDTPRKIKEKMSDYCLVDEVLMNKGKIYVPQNYGVRKDIVESRHDAITAGHPGRAKTLELVSRTYWWPSMTKFINDYVDHCDACLRTKTINQKPQGPLQPLEAPENRWTDITYDFIVKLPVTKSKNDSVLVVVDRFTKRAHFIATKESSNAQDTAKMFLENVWKHHGTPLRTISDRGTTFNSEFMKRLYELIGVKPNFSTAYHPQTDGQSERINSLMEQYLRLYNDWDEWLAIAEFQYNNSVSSSTGVTPFFADQGRHPAIAPQTFNETKVPAAEEMAAQIREIGEEVKAMLKKAEEKHRRFYDVHMQQATPHQVGDRVWLSRKDSLTGTEAIKTSRPSAKLEHRRFGPYEVIEKIGRSAYRLRLPETLKIHPVFHVSWLTATAKDPIEGRRVSPPPPVQNEVGEEEYEVERILDSRWHRTRFQYLVQWKRYDASENSWNYLEDTTNATTTSVPAIATQQQNPYDLLLIQIAALATQLQTLTTNVNNMTGPAAAAQQLPIPTTHMLYTFTTSPMALGPSIITQQVAQLPPKGPKVVVPNKYNGKKRGDQCYKFISSCEQYMVLSSQQFADNWALINWLMGYLTEEAQKWALIIIKDATRLNPTITTWGQFKSSCNMPLGT